MLNNFFEHSQVIVNLIKKSNRIFFLIILLFNFNSVYSQTKSDNLFSSSNRLAFGNHLFNEQDYLRAIDEYKNYLISYDSDTVRFKFAESFLRIGRYREAADNFKSLFFNTPLSDEAKLSFYKSLFFDLDFSSFREQSKYEGYFSEKYSKEINRLYFISHLMDDSVLPDTNIFFIAFPDSNKKSIREFYLMKKYPVKKNPATAMFLSILIPGAGKIYTGEVSDGITAFITTGLMAYLAVNNFKHNHNFRGWLFTSLAAFSYAGTVYGSYASAQIYNANVRFNFDKEVKVYLENRNYFLPDFNFINN